MPEKRDIFTAVHPVPMRFLPRRGRIERMAYAQVATPVRVTRPDPSDVGPTHWLRPATGVAIGFALIDGVPFLRAGSLTVSDLASYLSRGDAPMRCGPIDQAFAGTPLSARAPMYDDRGQYGQAYQQDFRGTPGVLEGAGIITHDGTQDARRDLQAFLDARVRHVGGVLYVEAGGPMVRQVRPGPGQGIRYEFTATPAAKHWNDSPLPNLSFAEALARTRPGNRSGMGAGFPGCDLPKAFRGKPDAALAYANAVPSLVIGAMGGPLRGAPRDALAEPDRRAAASRLCWMAMLGGIGAIAPGDVEATLSHAAGVATAMMPYARDAEDRATLRTAARSCGDLIQARADAAMRAVPAEDVDSIAGLPAPR